MSPADAKRMQQNIAVVMTLDRLRTAHQLDDEGLAVLGSAKRVLEKFSAREVVAGFLEWQANGMLRRDPRPRPTTDTAFLAGGAEARRRVL